jgi:hypothetical protein
MSAAFNINISVVYLSNCCECGVPIFAPFDFERTRREDKRAFYCVNGHSQSFTKSESSKLREQIEAEKRATEWQKSRAERLDKQLTAQKGETTKARNKLARVGAGMCPCCSRNFTNLRRHMATKHPQFRNDGHTEETS